MPAKHRVELRHLRYAVAIADAGGIAAAARRLRLAQPALSRQLRALETALGATLFERRGRGVVATPAGARFADAARDILVRVNAATDTAARMSLGLSGAISIGFNETASWHGVIPDTFRAFSATHPDVSLTAVPMNSVEQREALRQGQIDAGFVYAIRDGDSRAEPDDLAALDLASDPLMLAVRSEDALALLPEPISLSALDGSPFVWFDRPISPAYDDQVMAAFARSGMIPAVVQRTTNTSAMLALVNCGIGFTFAPLSAQHRKPTDVVLRALDAPDLDQTLRLAWRHSDPSTVVKRFVDCALQVTQRYERDNPQQ